MLSTCDVEIPKNTEKYNSVWSVIMLEIVRIGRKNADTNIVWILKMIDVFKFSVISTRYINKI